MIGLFESHACCNRLRDVNTVQKMLFVFTNAVIVSFSTSPVAPLMVFVSMTLLATCAARIPVKDYARALSVPLIITIPVFLVLAFTGSGNALVSTGTGGLAITAYRDGVNQGALLLARVLGGTSCMLFLAFTTPVSAIAPALRRVRVPVAIIEISLLIYRYIFVVIDEAARMERSQRARLGYAGFAGSLASAAILSTGVFVRAMNRGERLYVAMQSRCYSGTFAMFPEKPVSIGILVSIFGFEALVFAIMLETSGFRMV